MLSGGCAPAQSKSVPQNFDQDSFNEILEHVHKQYLDPQSINESRSYLGAAEAALKVLPYPLLLMSREYYQNRRKLQGADRIIPGRVIRLRGKKKYFIFEPDYAAYNKKTKNRLEKERKESKKLNNRERAQKFEAMRKKLKAEQSFAEKAWKKIAFSREDFTRIMKWISSNKENYSKPPSTVTREENPYKKDPFGMHHAYFAAINGYMSSLDPHSAVIDTKSWEKMLRESQDSSFEGIGAILRGGGTRDVVVESPLPGSPALAAGLRAGDIIRKVDGKPIESLPLSRVVKRIRGKKETVVELFVDRPIELRSLAIRIKRGLIKIKAVSSRYLPKERIGVIKITSFLYHTARPSQLVRREYDVLKRRSGGRLRGLIIDLRNNPGGDLRDAIITTGLFLPKNKIVVRIRGRLRSRGSDSRIHNEDKRNPGRPMIPMRGEFPAFPVIVLVNGGSASASEILASALMDHNAALVLGDRSFGKASVQSLADLGSVIVKLTTSRYYAPQGYTIQVYGIHPDVRVSDEPDGSFPPRYREEDMWKHLPELKNKKPDPARKAWAERLKKIVGKNEEAESYLKKHRNDALKPDYMLRRALTYLKAMRRFPRP